MGLVRHLLGDLCERNDFENRGQGRASLGVGGFAWAKKTELWVR